MTYATNVLRLWNSRNLLLEGRIIIFKILEISKIACLSLLTDVPYTITNETESIQKKLFMAIFSIKNKLKKNTFDDGGLENVDDNIKIISLQCPSKIILLYLISKNSGNNFNFHSSLSFNASIVEHFPKYYKETFMNLQNIH